jgi:peptidyl-prolyl cis-trans isomerase C
MHHFNSSFSILQVTTLAFALAMGLSGCGKSPKNGATAATSSEKEEIVAKADGVTVTRPEFEKAKADFLAQSGMNPAQLPEEMKPMLEKRVLEQKVTQELLLVRGEKMQIPDLDKKVEAEVAKIKSQFPSEEVFQDHLKQIGFDSNRLNEEIRNSVIINAVLEANIPKEAEPTEPEIKKFYTEHKEEFVQPKQVKASHILVKVESGANETEKTEKKKAIEKARARVIEGEDFGKVAGEVSEDPGSAKQGGDLGFFTQGQMVPEFDQVAFSSKKGQVSKVFSTNYGYHFLKVTDTKPEQTISFAQAKPQIAEHLKQQRQKEAIETFIKKVQDEGKIEYLIGVAPDAPAAS